MVSVFINFIACMYVSIYTHIYVHHRFSHLSRTAYHTQGLFTGPLLLLPGLHCKRLLSFASRSISHSFYTRTFPYHVLDLSLTHFTCKHFAFASIPLAHFPMNALPVTHTLSCTIRTHIHVLFLSNHVACLAKVLI